jgi:hypothetical protein
MAPEELTAHQIEQDCLDALEEARLLPIHTTQHEELVRFCNWMNSKHPLGAQFVAHPRKISDIKPYLECVGNYIEFKGEGTDELDLGGCDGEDFVLILWELYQGDQKKLS